MESYQHQNSNNEAGLSIAPSERPRSESLGNVYSLRKAALVATGIVLFGSVAIISHVAMDESSPMSMKLKQTPLLLGSSKPKPKVASNRMQLKGYPPYSVQQEYLDALSEINWKQVERDIEDLLTDSKDFWPADYGNYVGLFIRLSWHSCGSYRTSDGRGGCDGGGQRYVDILRSLT
jgi:hypothetical protein